MPLARTPLHAGGGGIAATALAFLAALLLAPGEARAADECGAISSTAQTATCSATTYTDGIIYENAAPGANNVATVVVPGGSTAWEVTSGAGGTRASNGITLDSDGAAGGGLALTVGGASATANRVAIRQRASNANSGTEDNNGILILQERTGVSTTTVTVNAGVTIGQPVGTGAGRMNRHGILARVNAGSGAAMFTNHAAIHSTLAGISVQRSSNAGTTAATTIANHGAISSGEEGIYLRYLAATSDAHTGGATITNTGAITTSGATQDGILMEYKNRGAAKITNSGAITATQSGSNAISLQHTGAAGGATVTNDGDIRSHALAISVLTSMKTAVGSNAGASVIHSGGDIDVSHQAGILVTVGEEGETIANAGDAEITVRGGSVEARDEALLARNRQAGNVVINVFEGVTLTSRTGEGILGDLPASNEKGGVTITNAAEITAAEVGILVRRTAPANAGNISITNHGAIKRTGDDVDFDGIRVEDDRGKGRVTVTNSGDIGEAGAMAMYLHGIQVQKTGSSGDLSVTTTGGSITAKDRGIYVTDNAGHTGAVTISNGGDVTADRPIYVNRNGEGPVTITNTGGTVRTESSHAIYAWNKTGDASDVRVNVEGGTVQSSRSALNFAHVNVVHAFNRGAGDVIVDVADGATLISRVSEAVYANLVSTTLAPDNQVKITQGGRMMGRTGVYARAGGYGVAAEGEEVAARAEGNPDVIDVTWTGSFSHGTTETEKAMVAQNDEGRFSAANVSDLVVFSQYVEAERATDGLYGSAAGVEAAVMPRRTADSTGILQVVAAGDVPGEFPDAAAQTALLAETGDASRRTAILAQFRAMLGNEEIDAASVRTAIDSTATTVADLSDEEILDYLGADTPGARVNLYNGLFGLSEAEKAILRAVATGGDVDAALRAAGFTDDPDDDEDYWSRVKALLNRYNPGNIKVAMNDGSIDSRGDGIRAYYATPHANNGAIAVTVAEGAEVTGAVAGIRVANAGLDAGEAGTADDILKQTVTVHGMVTGGTDAAVHLVGGGRLTVGEMGKVYAGDGDDSSGRAIWVNDPGRAVIRIDGEVKGGEGAPAAVHLTGGGRVEIGRTGRVEANGATNAIRGDKANDDTPATEVLLEVYGAVSRERAAEALKRVEGTIAGDGIDPASGFSFVATDEEGPTGMMMQIPVRIVSGRPDPTTANLPMEIDQPEVDCSLEGISCASLKIGESRAGVRFFYRTPSDDNGAIDVTVAEDTTVTGGAEGGIRVANAGLESVGMDTVWGRNLNLQEDAERLRQHFVTVHGTVTGGMGPAVHLAGGGALLVGKMGKVHAGAGHPAVLVNDPGEAIIVIHGEVKGSEGADAAVHLTGGGKVEIGLTGRVEANGATNAIRGDKPNADNKPPTKVYLHVDGDAVTRENAKEALTRLEGIIDGDGIDEAIGFSYVATDGEGATGMRTMQPARLVDGRPELPEGEMMTMDCKLASDDRCRLYEALPSALLAMNGLPTYEERMSAARDAKGGWARVEAARGKWKADSSTQENVAYDHSRSGVRAGMDFAAGETGLVGLSFHGLRGSAEMAQAGEIGLSGSGLGVHGTTALAGGFLVDAQAAVTWYDANLKSTTRTLENDVSGRGYALGVEVGKRLPAMDGGVTVTPRAGLLWSKADLDEFTDTRMATVSVKDAQSLKGRAGVGVEKVLDEAGMDGSRLFASLDVEQEFKEETEAMVSGTSLKASAKKTRLRAAAGGARVWGEGRYALQGSLGYAAGGGDNRDFGGGLSFAIRF